MSYSEVDIMLAVTKVDVEGLKQAPNSQVKLWCLAPLDTSSARAIYGATATTINVALALFHYKMFEVRTVKFDKTEAIEKLNQQFFDYKQVQSDTLYP